MYLRRGQASGDALAAQHHADIGFGKRGDSLLPEQLHGASVPVDHIQDQLNGRALARAVLTDNADELALLDREAQPVQGQRLGVGVAVFEVFHSNHRHWTILHSSAAAIMASSTTVMGVSPRCGVRSAR